MFKNIPFKTRLIISGVLLGLGFAGFVSLIVVIILGQALWIVLSVIGVTIISLVFGVLFLPPRDEIQPLLDKKIEENKAKQVKTHKHKSKRPEYKKSYISEEDWEELEMEDDEDERDERFLEDN